MTDSGTPSGHQSSAPSASDTPCAPRGVRSLLDSRRGAVEVGVIAGLVGASLLVLPFALNGPDSPSTLATSPPATTASPTASAPSPSSPRPSPPSPSTADPFTSAPTSPAPTSSPPASPSPSTQTRTSSFLDTCAPSSARNGSHPWSGIRSHVQTGVSSKVSPSATAPSTLTSTRPWKRKPMARIVFQSISPETSRRPKSILKHLARRPSIGSGSTSKRPQQQPSPSSLWCSTVALPQIF